MDSTRKAKEELEQGQKQEGTEMATIYAGPKVHSHVLCIAALARLNSGRSTGSGFRLDGQSILSPLLTQPKRIDMHVSRQMAQQLEKKFEADRMAAGQVKSSHAYTSVARRRGLPQLQCSETYIIERPPSPKKSPLGAEVGNGNAIQLLPSLTLQEPCQERKANAENIQREIIESKSEGCPPSQQVQPPHQQLDMAQPNLEQEIDLMIERTLNEHVDALRTYLRSHRDRFIQLVQQQHDERRRMQLEFDRQKKMLIQQISTEIELAATSGAN